jgi:hypothetical protein
MRALPPMHEPMMSLFRKSMTLSKPKSQTFRKLCKALVLMLKLSLSIKKLSRLTPRAMQILHQLLFPKLRKRHLLIDGQSLSMKRCMTKLKLMTLKPPWL